MEKIQSQSKNLAVKRVLCYVFLVLLTIISLFPFYAMIINSTRTHEQISQTFSAVPGKNFERNFLNLAVNKKTTNKLMRKWLFSEFHAEKPKAVPYFSEDAKPGLYSDRLEIFFNEVSSTTTQKDGNFSENYPIAKGMLNSLIIAILTALVTTYFSSMTSYGIYMYNFKGKGFSFKFILAVMMVPTQVSTLGFLRLLGKMHLLNNNYSSYIGLIVPAIAAPVVFFYMYQSMEATLPFSIVEAARVDGCHEFKTFNRIVIPMMKPAIAVQAIFAFVSSWNNYFIPALVISDKKLWTVPIVIANARNADYLNFNQGINYMLMTVAIVPLIIAYLFLSRYIISGATAGGVKE